MGPGAAADRLGDGRPAIHTVRSLLFDVFGTVVDWRSGIAREAGPVLARHGGDPARAAEFADAWRARYQPSMEEIRAGRRAFVPLDTLHRENLDAILPAFGLSALPEPERAALTLAWHRLDPWPDVVPGLARLKARHIIAPLSNGNIRLMIDMAKRAGLPWDAILGAEVARAYKPDPQAYLRTVAVLGLSPGEVCMVAAHEDDLAAAQACGLATALVPRPEEFGPGRAEAVRRAADWDHVAADFGALAGALERLEG